MINLSKKDIQIVLGENSDEFGKLGFKIAKSGRKMTYHEWSIAIITSKYGYDEEYGLNFFFRATRIDAQRDEWGNLKNMDDDEFDFYPSDLSKNSQRDLRNTTVAKPRPMYFSAVKYDEIEPVLKATLSDLAGYLNNKI